MRHKERTEKRKHATGRMGRLQQKGGCGLPFLFFVKRWGKIWLFVKCRSQIFLRCGDVLLEVYVSEKEQAVEKRVRIFCILWRKVAL